MIVQPRRVPQSYLALNWQILHFFAHVSPFCGSQRGALDDGIVSLFRVIPEITGSTRNFGRGWALFSAHVELTSISIGKVSHYEKVVFLF